MTVQPGRKIINLSFEDVEHLVKEEYALVEKGDEFEDNLHYVKVYRETWGVAYEDEDAIGWLTEDFSREDYRANDWVFHDQTPQAALAEGSDLIQSAIKEERKAFTRDEIQTAVSFALGRFYYSNPDSHKIVPEILKRLGF